MKNQDNIISRKTFLKKLGRFSLFAGLSGLCGKLLIQSNMVNNSETGLNCDLNYTCYDCRQIKTCDIINSIKE